MCLGVVVVVVVVVVVPDLNKNRDPERKYAFDKVF